MQASSVILAGQPEDHQLIVETLNRAGLEPPAEPEGYLLLVGAAGEIARSWGKGMPFALICGNDSRAVLYGLGRLLRMMDLDNPGLYCPIVTKREHPAGKERGVYFATHFNNWYESAPFEEVKTYVEDLALWGVNTLWTWFDMNWYPPGFWQQPESRGMRMINRLKGINAVARSLGMTVGLTGLANEGFKNQPPPDLRADISVRRGGFYPFSQICPSKPGGLEMILENRRKVLELLGPVDAFWYWPYDQGGCGCGACADEKGWGKTFLKIGPAVARVVKRTQSGLRFIVSTWYMSDGEMQLVYDAARRSDRWFDGILLETRRAGEARVPPDCALSVPEISMFDCFFVSYGCNGANPAPRRFVEAAQRIAELGYGAVVYSEGVYEDLNKVVWASVLWNPEAAPEDIVEEYCRYYFGRQNTQAGKELIFGLEDTWGITRLPSASAATTKSLLSLAESLEKRLPAADWCRWRWRLLAERARLDHLMVSVGPDKELLAEAKHLFDEAGFPDDLQLFRRRAEAYRDKLRSRAEGVRQLFQAYWKYLETFHLDTVMLVFRPDQFLGSVDYEVLCKALEEALPLEDEAMRKRLIRGFHRWFWFNGVDLDFLFL